MDLGGHTSRHGPCVPGLSVGPSSLNGRSCPGSLRARSWASQAGHLPLKGLALQVFPPVSSGCFQLLPLRPLKPRPAPSPGVCAQVSPVSRLHAHPACLGGGDPWQLLDPQPLQSRRQQLLKQLLQMLEGNLGQKREMLGGSDLNRRGTRAALILAQEPKYSPSFLPCESRPAWKSSQMPPGPWPPSAAQSMPRSLRPGHPTPGQAEAQG